MSLSKKNLRKCISKCLEGIMNKGDIHYIIMYKKGALSYMVLPSSGYFLKVLWFIYFRIMHIYKCDWRPLRCPKRR